MIKTIPILLLLLVSHSCLSGSIDAKQENIFQSFSRFFPKYNTQLIKKYSVVSVACLMTIRTLFQLAVLLPSTRPNEQMTLNEALQTVNRTKWLYTIGWTTEPYIFSQTHKIFLKRIKYSGLAYALNCYLKFFYAINSKPYYRCKYSLPCVICRPY